VFKSEQDGTNHQQGVNNPNYAQIITSNEILDDILNDDRIYEEIFARRRSSCIHPECIYANVEKYKAKPGTRKSFSQNNLEIIDEDFEQGTSNNDVSSSSAQYAVVKKVNNVTSPPSPNSPRLGFNKDAVKYNAANDNENDVIQESDDVNSNWNSKYDSGYMEELYDTGLESVNLDVRLVEGNGGNTSRKSSVDM